MEPYFHELSDMSPGNGLYAHWLEYLLSLSRDDIKVIIDNGLTHQARALRSMARELIAGRAIPTVVLKKLDIIVALADRKSKTLN